MSLARDIRFDDENNDLYINPETGDFLVTDSDTRHVNDLIESFAGWWKEFPKVGAGMKRNSAASGSFQRVSREVKIQMIGDGYSVTGISFDENSQIFVTGKRKNVDI